MSQVNHEDIHEDIDSASAHAEPRSSSAAIEPESTVTQDPPQRKRGRPPGTTKKKKSTAGSKSKKSSKTIIPKPETKQAYPSAAASFRRREKIPKLDESKKRRRTLTVYDVVANRMTRGGFKGGKDFKDGTKKKQAERRSGITTFADEVIARSSNAPQDVAPFPQEKRSLVPHNDLLFAVHQYTADFYTMNGLLGVNHRSFDETALIAMAELLENSCEKLLGEKGHLALVDRELVNEDWEDEDTKAMDVDSEGEGDDSPASHHSEEEIDSD
jgi:hypothetical protein